MRQSKGIRTALTIFFFLTFLVSATDAAPTIDELRSRIDSRTAEIKKLEAEIADYQSQLSVIGRETLSLQGEINRLETTRKKLAADIKVTENKIELTDLEIEKIILEIGKKNLTVSDRQASLAETLREWRDRDNESLLEIILNYPQLADFWSELDQLAALQRKVQENIVLLRSLRNELQISKSETESKREELANLRARLSDQKTLAEENKAEKNNLLKLTKNKESNYQVLLAASQAKKESFEQELYDLEAQLRIAIDPRSLPPAGKGVLVWPLDDIFVTQKFGKTVDAQRLYASGTHNGVDFRAAVGTSVKVARAGMVTAIGDTDSACPGVSYGKWVLVKHENGLSTLYAHLSLIIIKTGETVKTSQLIAYSGRTGYATGPHLHLSVFATQGVKVGEYNFKSCAGAKISMPIAGPNAYLDPLIYL